MAKLVLGAFMDMEQVTQALRDFERFSMPEKDLWIGGGRNEQLMPIWAAGSFVTAGGIVGSMVGLALGAVMLQHMSINGAAAVLAGFGWTLFFTMVCGVIGGIIGTILDGKVHHPQTTLSTPNNDNVPLGIADKTLAEAEIHHVTASIAHDAEQSTTATHPTPATRLIVTLPERQP